MSFNRLKGLQYIMHCQSIELFFNRLISLKSSEISWLYGKFNRMFSLKPDYICCVFESRGVNLSFWARNFIILLWKTLSLQYTTATRGLKILEAFWLVSSLKNTCMVGWGQSPSSLDVLVPLVDLPDVISGL